MKRLRRHQYDPAIIKRTVGIMFGPSTTFFRYFLKSCSEWDWLFNVTCNDISGIYVAANRCAGGLKKKLFDLRSGSQRLRHFVGFFNVPVKAPTRASLFNGCTPTNKDVWTVWWDLFKPPQRRQGPDPRPLWLLFVIPYAFGLELAFWPRVAVRMSIDIFYTLFVLPCVFVFCIF